MLFLERKFTAYTGTVLENIRDNTYQAGKAIFYRKQQGSGAQAGGTRRIESASLL